MSRRPLPLALAAAALEDVRRNLARLSILPWRWTA